MAQLTEEEAAQLKALQEKQEAPDPPANGEGGVSRVLNVTVDLGDEAQVERAIGFGFLTRPEAEGDEGDEDEGDEDDEGPRRRGFFPEK